MNDALKGIESAAFKIAEERARLERALDGLRIAVNVLDNTKTLNNDGSLVDATQDAVVEEPVVASLGPGAVATVEADRASRDQEGESKVRAGAIAAWVMEKGPRQLEQVKSQFPDWNVRPTLDKLEADGILTRTGDGLYKHKDWKGYNRGTGGTRGSGRRQDISPTSTPPTRQSSPPSPASTGLKMEWVADVHSGLGKPPKPYGEMRPQQQAAEKRLDLVVWWIMQQHGPINGLDMRHTLGVAREGDDEYRPGGFFANQSQALGDLRILEDRGVIKRTGNQIFPQFKLDAGMRPGARGIGRTTAEYVLTGGEEFTSPKAEPAPASSESERDTELAPVVPLIVTPTLEQVRDAAVKLKTNISMSSLASEMGVSIQSRMIRRELREHMAVLTRRGMFKADNEDGGPISKWDYIEPTDMGSAARLDQRLRGSHGDVSLRGGRSRPVSGTGKKEKATHPEIQSLINHATRLGATVSRVASGHWEVRKGAQKVLISSTPSGSRSVLNDKARLRRMGLAIP